MEAENTEKRTENTEKRTENTEKTADQKPAANNSTPQTTQPKNTEPNNIQPNNNPQTTQPKNTKPNNIQPNSTPQTTQPNNPLHGVKLADMLEYLVGYYGWEQLSYHININCFTSNPSIKSSLKFLRRTPWAREKVEKLYLKVM